MSWLSQFVDDPIGYLHAQPLKALSLLAAPVAAIGGAFAAPAAIGALGLGAAGEAGAAGAGALGAGSFLGDVGAGIGSAAGGIGSAFGDLAGGIGGAASEGVGALGDMFGMAPASGADAGLSAFSPLEGGIPGPDGSLSTFLNDPTANFGVSPSTDALSSYGEIGSQGSVRADGLPGTVGDIVGGEAAPMGGMPGEPAAPPVDGGGGMLGKGGTDAAGGNGSFLDNLWGNTKSYAMEHPFQSLGAGIAGLGLANNLYQGTKTPPYMAAMQGQAGQMGQMSQTMMRYLQTGTLPPGLQTAINQATQAAKARMIANAARNGMPTDPSQNSALAQDLNNIDLKAQGEMAQQALQLMSQGVTMAGISANLYGQLQTFQNQQNQQTGLAIANFAAALNGAGRVKAPGSMY